MSRRPVCSTSGVREGGDVPERNIKVPSSGFAGAFEPSVLLIFDSHRYDVRRLLHGLCCYQTR